jgi:peptidoglycan/LPS O-acetylase OafA/YrhL
VLHSTRDWWQITSSYLFLPSQNADGKLEPLLGVGWTLNFEMFFYAAFALALLLRRNPQVVVAVVLAGAALGALWRQPDWPAISFYLSPRVLEFYGGMLLVPTVARRPLPWPAAITAVAAGFAVLLAGPLFLPPLPFLAAKALPALLVVAGVISLEPLIGPRLPVWTIFMGGASYALYLFHPVIAPAIPATLAHLRPGRTAGLMGTAGSVIAVVSVLAAVTVAVAGSCLLHVMVERPLTSRLNATLRRRAAPVEPQSRSVSSSLR